MRNLTCVLAGASMLALPVVAYAADSEAVAIGRCTVPEAAPLFAREALSLPTNWRLETPSSGDPALPAVMVDGWTPGTKKANMLLGDLMAEAGLSYDGPADLPLATWSGKTAPLSKVVANIVGQFGGFSSFDGKTLHVLAKAPPSSVSATIAAPSERDLRLALVDTLRGFDLEISATSETISLSGSKAEVDKARAAIAAVREVNIYDVVFLRGRPAEGRYDWKSLGAVQEAGKGAGGDFVFIDPEPGDVIARMKAAGDLVEDSRQSVAAPKGWALAVPPAQCGAGKGEVVVGLEGEPGASALVVKGGGASSSFQQFSLGSTAIAANPEPVDGWINMVLVRPRVVRLAGT